MYPLPELHTERTCIRLPKASDAPLLLRYRIDNREHFAPWEPRRDEAYFTGNACRRVIDDGLDAARADRAYPFLVLDTDQREVLASITLTNVARGIFQACHMGYGVAAAWQGKRLMHEALCAVLDLAFGTLELHRVMANHLPDNERSARLLERLGFEREGYARSYLCIDGRWQDHVLTAKINPQSGESSPAA
ncbi:MAG TPA: GNAT family N-acetyltransferase [Rhodanobacteraceae bacterium]|nr:GNAT family N-acetyltransferase [Rhodanobacteraceae bacterium]